ncbi:MAG: putative T7SS-secreted protein, partial [Phycicoccus sp.]
MGSGPSDYSPSYYGSGYYLELAFKILRGSPGQVSTMATKWQYLASRLSHEAVRLYEVRPGWEVWDGEQARRAYDEQSDNQAARTYTQATLLSQASLELERYAIYLKWAQEAARAAIDTYNEGVRLRCVGEQQLRVSLVNGDQSGVNAGHQTMANGTVLKERGQMMAHGAWERLEQNGNELATAIRDLQGRIDSAGGDAHLEAAAAGLLGLGVGSGAVWTLGAMGPWALIPLAIGAGYIGTKYFTDPEFRQGVDGWIGKQPDRINRMTGAQGEDAQRKAFGEAGNDLYTFSGAKDLHDGIASGNRMQAFGGGFQIPQTIALGRDLTRLGTSAAKGTVDKIGRMAASKPPATSGFTVKPGAANDTLPFRRGAVNDIVPFRRGGPNGGYSSRTPPVASPPALGQSTVKAGSAKDVGAIHGEWNVPTSGGPPPQGPKALAGSRYPEAAAAGGLAPEQLPLSKSPTTVTPDPLPDTIAIPDTPPSPVGPGQLYTVAPDAPVPTSPTSPGGPPGPPVTVPATSGGSVAPTPPLHFPGESPSGGGPQQPVEAPEPPPPPAERPPRVPTPLVESPPSAAPDVRPPEASTPSPVVDSAPVAQSAPAPVNQSVEGPAAVTSQSTPAVDPAPVSQSSSAPAAQSGEAPAGAAPRPVAAADPVNSAAPSGATGDTDQGSAGVAAPPAASHASTQSGSASPDIPAAAPETAVTTSPTPAATPVVGDLPDAGTSSAAASATAAPVPSPAAPIAGSIVGASPGPSSGLPPIASTSPAPGAPTGAPSALPAAATPAPPVTATPAPPVTATPAPPVTATPAPPVTATPA